MSDTFAFGANWMRFLRVVNDERIEFATRSVQRLTGAERLDGRRFLDIGSGSGLFSLAARRLGAQVVSFDVDVESVACTIEMKRRYARDDPRWRIERGSVLDTAFLASLGTFDVVYSWGVLHHTGDMWRALENAVGRVAPSGTLCVALYNHQRRMTPVWQRIKRMHQRVPKSLRPLYAAAVIAPWEVRLFLPHPVRHVRYWLHYAERSQRGMSRWRDIVDWVGGYPFETSTPKQVVEFCVARDFLLYALTTAGDAHGCNEYGFVNSTRPATAASTAVGPLPKEDC